MWYVEYISHAGHYTNARQEKAHCFHYGSLARKDMSNRVIMVRLRESETHECVEITHYGRKWIEFEQEIQSYHPYGYIWTGDRSFILVCMDELSIRFLDYIEQVTSVYDAGGDAEFQKVLDRVGPNLSFYDNEYRTIVNCGKQWRGVAEGMPFSLFHVICFLPLGWYGDSYYLKETDGLWYRVHFNNVTKAKSLVSKAVTMGINPIMRAKFECKELFDERWHRG